MGPHSQAALVSCTVIRRHGLTGPRSLLGRSCRRPKSGRTLWPTECYNAFAPVFNKEYPQRQLPTLVDTIQYVQWMV